MSASFTSHPAILTSNQSRWTFTFDPSRLLEHHPLDAVYCDAN